MEVTSVNCNNCGAPLEVGAGANFATCRHCGSHLAIRRTASAAYTELLGELDRKTDAIASKVEVLLRQNELEQIDREWEEERKRYLSKDKHGEYHEPTAAGAAFMAVVVGVIGLIIAASTARETSGGGAVCTGVVAVAVAAMVGLHGMQKAREYEGAKARHHQRRAAAAAPRTAPEPDRTPGSV